MTGQCNFGIAPVIYHFLILYISFANLKNFGFLRLHLHSRFINFSQSVDLYVQYTIEDREAGAEIL
jgi:hypothetical protein